MELMNDFDYADIEILINRYLANDKVGDIRQTLKEFALELIPDTYYGVAVEWLQLPDEDRSEGVVKDGWDGQGMDVLKLDLFRAYHRQVTLYAGHYADELDVVLD